jgi:hypothetical protein
MTFFIIWLTMCATIGGVATIPFWVDRVVVRLLPGWSRAAFPAAARVALSLERDTADWRFSDSGAQHQGIGEIRAAYGPRSLHVLVEFGTDRLDWEPNFLERRLLWNALRAARARLIHEQLAVALPA